MAGVAAVLLADHYCPLMLEHDQVSGNTILFISCYQVYLYFQRLGLGLQVSEHMFTVSACSNVQITDFQMLYPVDKRFLEHILPAILESPWPRLRSMELFGVARYSTPDGESMGGTANLPLADEVQRNIRRAVGPTAQLDIRVNAERIFWRAGSEAGTGIPRGDIDVLIG